MKDALVIGFGIAGLSVAKHLELKNKTFDIIADDSQQSSKVAGGVLNPVALKRYNLAWKADHLMPEAISFYSNFKTETQAGYFAPTPVFKLFSSIEDQNNWSVASDQPKLDPFLNPTIQSLGLPLHLDFKAGEVLQTHLLHLKPLIEAQTQKYKSSNQFLSERFAYDDLQIDSSHVKYKGISYKSVIFCEGFGVLKNPFFNWLPLYGNKGEYLIFKSEELNANDIILKSRNFIIPLGYHMYKYGATYSREQLNDSPTDEARADLKAKLSKMIDCEFEVIDQIAGVRPTVRDRKPILGKHPKLDHLFVLNGFGSRGVMAAPQLSRNLIEHIFEGKAIDEEVAISRFEKLCP
jgi:glycine/D-amino acid oxidase-like deaminating enzyme